MVLVTEIPADVTTIGDKDADQGTTVEPVTTTRLDIDDRLEKNKRGDAIMPPEGDYCT